MNIVTLGKKNYLVPSTWQELSRKKFIKAVKVIYSLQLSRAEQLISLLFIFLPAIRKYFKKLDEDQIYDLSNLFSFLLDTLPDSTPINRISKLYLPAAKLEYSSIVEFALAEQYFEAYKETRDNQFLYHLLATLCREKAKQTDSSGEMRIKVDTRFISKNTKVFYNQDPALLMSVLHFYLGCRQYVFNTYFKVFEKATGGSGEGGSSYNYFDMIRDAAKTNLYGGMEQTQHFSLHVILMHIHRERLLASEAA